MSASALLGAPETVKLYFKLEEGKVYNCKDKKETGITFIFRIGVNYDSSTFKDATEEFCLLLGLRKIKGNTTQWNGNAKKIPVDDQLRRWNPKVYDCTCLHPEFPHLISSLQEGRSKIQRDVLLGQQ